MKKKDERIKLHFTQICIFELTRIANRGIRDIIDDQIRRGITPPVAPPLDIEEYKKSRSIVE